jgi:hypothetical protein
VATDVVVEAMLVAPTQPEGDVSSAGTPKSSEAQAESWNPGPRVALVESWAPCGV